MKHLRYITIIILCCLGMTFIMSCQGDLYYADYKNMPQGIWDSRDTLSFIIPPSAQDADVELTISIRNTKEYKYESLALRAFVVDYLGCVRKDMTIAIMPDGKQSKIGAICAYNSSEPVKMHLKAGRRVTLRLSHRMRLNPIEGITDVEITLVKK